MKPSQAALGGWIAIWAQALACTGAMAQAQPGPLLSPSWDDPFLADYLRRGQADAAPALGGVTFSLPVLGFATSRAPGDAAPALPLGDQLAAAIPTWPACAADRPAVVTVPNTPDQAAGSPLGTWFSSTYDFGCVQIVVEGDRNAPDPALAPALDAAPESGSISVTYDDENAGMALDATGNEQAPPLAPTSGTPIISYSRGGLTYGITVACVPESQAFCEDRSGLRILTEQLVPVAGRPQP